MFAPSVVPRRFPLLARLRFKLLASEYDAGIGKLNEFPSAIANVHFTCCPFGASAFGADLWSKRQAADEL